MESSTGIAFLEFSDSDRQRLLEAYVYIQPSISTALDSFYDSLISIDADPRKYGAELDALKARQSEHWRRLFRGTFGTEYENTARRIAIKHYEIGLPHDLYLLSYMKILALFHELIGKAPGLERTTAREMSEAVTKAIAIDMMHAVTPYSGDLV